MTDTWYFAYGSNLLLDQKTSRTGTIRVARRARLSGYRLAFNKRMRSGGGVYANIVPAEAGDAPAEVLGVAYLCDEAAIAGLDHYEGDVLQALTYVAGEQYAGEDGRPQPGYVAKILDGARQHGLPEDYIAALERLGRS